MLYTLNTPTVGPILGHTTRNDARVFFRGDPAGTANLGRCLGAARFRKAGGSWSEPIINKLSPNFDVTGVFVFQDLTADTRYEYQAGWFVTDEPADDIDGLKIKAGDLDWSGSLASSFTSVPDSRKPRSYVIGSCRYLLRLFGGSWFDDRGDKVFRSIQRQIDGTASGVSGPRPVDALLMMGDQVYADDLKGLAPDRRLEDFLERYRVVLSQEHLRALMSRVPTYMILDDHEIEDNWPSNASEQDWLTLYPHAIHAYQIYQCSHGPLFTPTNRGRIDGTLKHFWYKFSDEVCEWFVMDTRTERSPSTGRMVGPEQMIELLKWLDDGSGRIKFIVTSVPMFPDMASDADDKWQAYPGQRKEILDFVFSRRIPNVVVLSGDVHASFSCSLQAAGDASYAVHGVVSSSFFWPYPHMSRGSFLFSQPLSNMGTSTLVPTRRTDDCFGDDNFTRLDASLDPPSITVSVFERKGAGLQTDLLLF